MTGKAKTLSIEAARQLVAEQGTRIAQELFRKTYDIALADAISEKFDERADAFNSRQRRLQAGKSLTHLAGPKK
jgi:hypothetical protein